MHKSLIILPLLICFKLYSQDLIVYKGDSINCKIIHADTSIIKFNINRKNEILETHVNTESVQDYKFDYYKDAFIKEVNIRAIISAGTGINTYHLNNNSPSLGLGFEYEQFTNKTGIGFLYLGNIRKNKFGDDGMKIQYHYTGPVVGWHLSHRKNTFIKLTSGYYYLNKGLSYNEINITYSRWPWGTTGTTTTTKKEGKATGGTFGLGAGFDTKITRVIRLGGTFIYGKVNNPKLDFKSSAAFPENMSMVNFYLGICLSNY